MKDTNISIILPTLTINPFLIKIINHLTEHIHSNDEIILLVKHLPNNKKPYLNPYVKIFQIPSLNLAETRNYGIKNAKNSILAFLDDDTYPMDGWIKYVQNLCDSHKNVIGFGGYFDFYNTKTLLNKFEKKLYNFIIHQNVSSRFLSKSSNFSDWFLIRTGNCIIRKKHHKILFSKQFSNCGEDLDLIFRLLKKDYIFYYDSNLKIFHKHKTLKSLCKEYFKFGIASANLTKVHFQKIISIDIQELRLLFYFLFRLGVNILRIKKHRMAKVEIWWLFTLISHYLGKIYGSMKFGIIRL